jgi:glycosyltransferase involved in cell wall biosynthesis/2-polyprenyl-3-methyl-5-hydroxy-6-metoxy-1,4-benzoquinol methylase
MHWPKISIVTPSYNQGEYIERTVRSVLLQRYPDLEYIVMDGGSTDDTVERLQPYKDKFSYFVSERDEGQADAIAKGFARSSGEIMAYLNSDDLLAPDALHFVARFFQENPNIDWIYSHRCTIDDRDRVIWYWILPPHQSFLMRRWDYIPQETCFWRRSLFEKTGNIDRSYRFAMDYDLFVRFMNAGHGRRLNRFLGAFRDHNTSKTKQLLATTGAREMLRVRLKFRIRAAITDGLFGLLIGNWVQYAGRYFAAAAHSLPGGFGGLGYDYNDVWGGLLRPNDVSSADPDGSKQFEEGFYSPLCPVTFSLADRMLYRVTSVAAGHIKASEIYLNSKPGVAIVAPGVEDEELDPQNDESKNPPALSSNIGRPDSPRSLRGLVAMATEAVHGLPLFANWINVSSEKRPADDILRMTQGLVSRDDEIAFLDATCSNGDLLSELAAQTKWKLFSLEAEAATAGALSKGPQAVEVNLRQAVGTPEMLQGFDFVYLGNGLQRFREPRVTLRTLAILLNPGGFLLLSTPNLDSEQRKLFGPAWAHWQPDEHRFIYSKRSLIKLLTQAGFRLLKLQTASHLESTTLSFRNLDDGYRSDVGCGNHPELIRNQAERISRASHLFWDKLGRGDEILAVFRRIS